MRSNGVDIEIPGVVHWRRPERGSKHDGYTNVIALVVAQGKKYLKVIPIDSDGMRVLDVPLAEARDMRPALYKDRPYPLRRALPRFRRMHKRFGGTLAAKRLLKEASK